MPVGGLVQLYSWVLSSVVLWFCLCNEALMCSVVSTAGAAPEAVLAEGIGVEAPNLPKLRVATPVPETWSSLTWHSSPVASTVWLGGRDEWGCLKQFHSCRWILDLLLRTVTDNCNGICFVGLRGWFALPHSWDRVTMGDTFSSHCVGKSLTLYLFTFLFEEGVFIKQNFAYCNLQQSLQFQQQ